MKSLPILLVFTLLPCTAATALQAPAPQVQAAYTTPAALGDVMTVYDGLHRIISNMYGDEPQEEYIRTITQKIRPSIARLRTLPPEQLKQVCLLADAILWQKGWIEVTYCTEINPDIEFEWMDYGFELLDCYTDSIRKRLHSKSTPEAEKAAWHEMLQEFGGEAALELPGKLRQQRWAKDYKTTLGFFKEVCAAAVEKNEAACLEKLREQAGVLEYFRQGGEMELLRVNGLVEGFREALSTLTTLAKNSPFPRPVLPEHRRTAARMAALEPFFTALPELRNLLLEK